jgi:hypothetical protein
VTRILLHVGLHKTATSSVQAFLRQNIRLFWNHAAVLMPHKMGPARMHAIAYGNSGDPLDLALMQAEMRAHVQGLRIGRHRDIVLSCEDFMGAMPDAGALYPHAGPLIRALIACFDHLPDSPPVHVYLSLRDPVGWVDSLWRHRLRKLTGAPLTQGREDFARALGPVDLPGLVARLRRELAPVPIYARDIADLADRRFGVAQPLVNFLPFTEDERAALVPPGRVNVGHAPALSEALLALNRAPMTTEARANAKLALLETSDD